MAAVSNPLPIFPNGFSLDDISPQERKAFRDIFNNETEQGRIIQQRWKDCRDWMVIAYCKNPETELNITTCRRFLNVDVIFLTTIFNFLNEIKFINFEIKKEQKATNRTFAITS